MAKKRSTKAPGSTWLGRREYSLSLRCEKWGVPYTKVSRVAVFRRDNWTCQLCGEPIDRKLRYPHSKSKSIDHIKPLSWGPERSPGHVIDNVQASHFGCNASKGNRYE